jgi:drug/metabolite transporter (DMT)-like permease
MPAIEQKRPLYGMIMILISGLFWSSITILSKIGIQAGLNTFTINAFRFFVSVAVVFIFLFFFRRDALKLERKKMLTIVVLGVFDYAIGGVLFIGSLQFIDASLAFLVLYIYPAMVAIGSAMIGRDKLTWYKIVSVILAIVGVGFLLEAGFAVSGDQWIGVALVFGAASIFTVYMLVVDSMMSEVRSSTVSFYSLLGGAIGMLLIIPFVKLDIEAVFQFNNFILLLFMAIFGTAISVLTFLAGLRHIGPVRTAILTTLEPVFVVLIAATFLKEHLSPWQLFGAFLQISGFLLVQFEARKLEKIARQLQP